VVGRYRGPVISVVMPAHNEAGYLEASVGSVLAALRAGHRPFEIILCENGSKDDTAALAERLAAAHPEVRAQTMPVADYGLALRSGFLAAHGDLVANFDVDYVDVGFLEQAVKLLDADPAVAAVVGTKRGPGAQDTRGVGRRAVTAGFSLVLRRGFGLQVSDTHGVKVLRRAPLRSLVAACRFGADLFDTELILRAERAGLMVAELPVTVEEQRPARTSIARRIPRTLVGLVRLRWALRRDLAHLPAPDPQGG
jgi:glycosyltransferase involved in cell wall biosynthesis